MGEEGEWATLLEGMGGSQPHISVRADAPEHSLDSRPTRVSSGSSPPPPSLAMRVCSLAHRTQTL